MHGCYIATNARIKFKATDARIISNLDEFDFTDD